MFSNSTYNDSAKEALELVSQESSFEIAPCDMNFDFEDKTRFTKLALTPSQKIQVGGLLHDIPSMLSTGAMAQAYTVKFPEGLPHTLAKLDRGGYSSMIRGGGGKFIGSASFNPMTAQALAMGAFSAMSVASGQYFLAQINSEMRMMRMKLDEVLEFLYGDKKAELMSEMSFIRSSYQNFSSIMSHEQQRVATIISLQSSKKIALKDIEFYIHDLENAVTRLTKDYDELRGNTDKAFRIKESLELSQQLYVMSSMMEVYFSQNLDEEYLDSLEGEMLAYIDKCDKRMLGSFSTLKGHLVGYKGKPMEKVHKNTELDRVDGIIDTLNSGEETGIRKTVRSALHAASKPAMYYLGKDGNVYVKAEMG